MTRTFIDLENERDMVDGILQPGGHFRMPMFLRDSVTINPALSPTQRAIATAARDAATFDASLHKPGPRYAAGTNDAARDATVAARNAAYEEYSDWITDAWKSKAPPAGSYPAANGAHVGDSCTVNGSPGRLRAIAGHDGYLECVATNSNDSTHDAANAQQIKDAAYSEYSRDLENAWRNK